MGRVGETRMPSSWKLGGLGPERWRAEKPPELEEAEAGEEN